MTQELGAARLAPFALPTASCFLFFLLHEILLLYVKKVMTSSFVGAGSTKKWGSSQKKNFNEKNQILQICLICSLSIPLEYYLIKKPVKYGVNFQDQNKRT